MPTKLSIPFDHVHRTGVSGNPFGWSAAKLVKHFIARFAFPLLMLLISNHAFATGLDFGYCSQGNQDFVIVAHTDDDLYFMNPDIQNDIRAGKCVKTIHLTGGYADKNNYQDRINGSLSAYAAMAGISSPNRTEYWDSVNGKYVHRYSLVVNSDPVAGLSKQIIKVQDLGLPCGWKYQGSTGVGALPEYKPISYLFKSLAYLYNDATAFTKTIDGKFSQYSIVDVSSFLHTVLAWGRPNKIFATDPYEYYFDCFVGEGQHPDHIVTAKLVAASQYVKSINPSDPAGAKVNYYKTYNVNDLTPDLSLGSIIQKSSVLAAYWTEDTYGNHTPLPGNSGCHALTGAQLWNPNTSWACKQYPATNGNYFYSSNLIPAGGFTRTVSHQCLSTTSTSDVLLTDCASTGVDSNVFSMDGQQKFYVDNGTRKLIVSDDVIGNRLQTVSYDKASAAQLAQKWRFDASGVFQVFDDTTQSMICVGFDLSYYAINVNCGSNPPIIFKPSPVKYAAPVQGIVLKNVQTQRCVVGGTSGNVQLGGCNSAANLVSINATGVIQLLIQPLSWLQASNFEQSSYASAVWCNSSSNGQHIQLKQIDGTLVSTC